MQNRYPIKVGRYFISLLAVETVLSADINHNIGENLYNNTFIRPEQHIEEFFHSDINELYRDKNTASVTGTGTILIFNEKKQAYSSKSLILI